MKALPTYWATPEDFATLFQYFWHRDLPIDLKSIGARRIDWTIHIGIIVRSIGDLMGVVTRFERGGRKDAIFRSVAGDEVALEWEWQGIKGQNELTKLKKHKVWGREGYNHEFLKYGVLITYLEEGQVVRTVKDISEYWKDARWPLLLIFIVSEKMKKLTALREFISLRMYMFETNGEYQLLRDIPAMPWKVDCSRWQFQLIQGVS
ncbi:hypothetical protein ACFLW9_02585 [Chloroflexota bacterium]